MGGIEYRDALRNVSSLVPLTTH